MDGTSDNYTQRSLRFLTPTVLVCPKEACSSFSGLRVYIELHGCLRF